MWGDILKAGWGGLEIDVEKRGGQPDLMGSTSHVSRHADHSHYRPPLGMGSTVLGSVQLGG